MPRGLPDYYNPDTLVSQRLANVEEIVTQLRGFASLDNRGRTLFTETFDNSLNGWVLLSQNDGVDAVISTDQALVEPSSMKMDAGTLSASGVSGAEKYIIIANIGSAGLELGIFWKTGISDLRVLFSYDDGVNARTADFLFDHVNKLIKIYSAADWHEVYDLGGIEALDFWLIVKLVVDFENKIYLRLLVGMDQVDLSDYSLVDGAHVLTGLLRFRLSAQPPDDNANISYIGLASLTIDEP